ncbi:MAG: HAMP domain-containing protein [Leptospiraceae bacterium]|nr:HAMP domain-containing protein [Leptospiraceae bacterium]MCP5497617.1 HAMP domain-containing protein [Leptospiraceae bacterium]
MKIKTPFTVTGELRYYLKDLYFFLLSIFFSIVLAETIIFTNDVEKDLVDKIFVYTYFIVPIFSLSLVLSYIYRNIRIKQTGKARSIIRYRLTLAFIFISILPSIPIFLLSSNVVGKLVESFYRIDVSEALDSAKQLIARDEKNDKKVLIQLATILQQSVTDDNPHIVQIHKKAIELDLLHTQDYYLAFIRNKKIVSESLALNSQINLDYFKRANPKDKIESYTLYKKDKIYLLVKIELLKDEYVILGKRVHKKKERIIYNIVNTEYSYNTANLWKEKVPFALRFALGMFSLLIFGLSIILSYILARQISRPIILLADATQRVSKGEADVHLELKEEGEMGILIESFNQMTMDLKAKKEELIHIQRIAAWKEVAQRMAHEIKNPLTPIQLSAERILRKLENQSKKEKFEDIVKSGAETIIGQVKVLEHLVREFSEFARMPNPVLIKQNVNPIIEESMKLFKDNVNIRFQSELANNLPEVFIDKRLFLGVFNNIIKNAIEAILGDLKEKKIEYREKEIVGTIRIVTNFEKKYIRKYVAILIEDSGPGLNPNLREKIFQPYFSTKEGHGTGIGLAIVEKTVYDHHGIISIEKSSLGGCALKIKLPVEN